MLELILEGSEGGSPGDILGKVLCRGKSKLSVPEAEVSLANALCGWSKVHKGVKIRREAL